MKKGPYRKKTHCYMGHAYTPENTRVNDKGHRSCKACRRIRESFRYTRAPKRTNTDEHDQGRC